MHRTRLSLFYLASYLSIGGMGLLSFPQATLKLLLSNGNYPDVIVRLTGIFMFSLGLVVFQFIRFRSVEQYSGTLLARILIMATLIWLYVTYTDPMLLVVLVIVAIGFVVTLSCFLWDRATATAELAKKSS